MSLAAPARVSDPARPVGPAQQSSLDPSGRAIWAAARGPLLVAVVVLLGALVLALTAGGSPGRLDPRSPAPAGSRAVAQVLGDHGVEVARRTTTSGVARTATRGSTVLISSPDLLVDEQVRALYATGADLVVVAPTDPRRFAAAVSLGEASEPEVRQPGCRLRAARRAGGADTGGLGYLVEADAPGGERAIQCYARDGVPSLVQVRAAGRAITVLGNPTALTNAGFGEEGNAALALGLLGGHDRLVWYLPSLSDVPAQAQQRSFYDLVPSRVWWGLVQLGVAVLLLAAWRARRLGPVVAEPLPVVVRAAEATEGRARLYRRAGALGTAAESLRSGVRARLGAALRLPPGPAPTALVDAVAARSRRTTGEVHALLYGAAPADDPALVRLADELDALDQEVRRP